MIVRVAQLAGMSTGAPRDEVRRILLRYRRLAVVGLSPNPSRPSYRAMVHMRAAGYDITPVNPTCREVLGVPCAPDARRRRGARAARDRRHLPRGRRTSRRWWTRRSRSAPR